MSDELIDAVVVERTFDAPIALVWQMWTEPEHFKKWYGPQGASVPVAEMDVRVGGKHLFCMEMQTPNGTMQMCTAGEYLEVMPTVRLVYTDNMSDENGNVMAPPSAGNGDGHPTTRVIVELEDLGKQTKMVLTHAGLPGGGDGAAGGWEQAFTKMADHIASVLGT